MINLKKVKLFLSVIALTCSTSLSRAELVWIVNPGVVENSLTKANFKKVLLGKTLVWKSGDKVELTTLFSAKESENLYKEYSGKTPKQYVNYWKKLVFIGKGTLPKPFSSEEELISYVAETPGAVGYIDSSKVTENVKVLKVD